MNLSESFITNVKKVENEFGITLSVFVLDGTKFFKIEIFPLILSLILVMPVK